MKDLALIQNDPYLKPFEQKLIQRMDRYQNTKNHIDQHFGSLESFASAHLFYGFNYDKENKGWWFRDWLPNAHFVSLIGDFNQWNRSANPLIRKNFGIWEIFLSDEDYKNFLIPGSKIKMHVHGQNGQLDRIPAYIRQVHQNEDHGFDGIFIGHNHFQWKNEFKFDESKPPLIYEAHVGMATEENRVGTYREFADNILPKIKNLGYNCVQLMAVMEHPYYGSFGYQVSNFFAPSSRFGSPNDLRYLIDTAHGLDLAVILDVVHSHAVKNREEGLAELDGTELYFAGWHPDWDSRLFDYNKIEVKQFLASNLKYWMEEFKFDGFRFDGVTSMLYHHFGHVDFVNYSSYFENTNLDAIIYLQLANELIHQINPNIISICEDMSGMPGAARPVEEGGLGFDYRLAMGIPDFWFTVLEKKKDEDWHMGDIYWNLINRRNNEKNIAYVESHDQALVGDKTLAFWLMDASMYTDMSIFIESPVIDRGIALHKMIRFITVVLGGEAYMNFMGNEFGHPEWIDFPRKENNWSYDYARRQWSLAESDHLKYKFLNSFDKEMIDFIKVHGILKTSEEYKLKEDNQKKILAFRKADLIFVFNFNQESFENFQIDTREKKDYKIIFSSDDASLGGFDRVDKDMIYSSKNHELTLYLPSRMVLVLKNIL